jgi:prepilin-type N-terminal cleavage/methylation domain-containing protein
MEQGLKKQNAKGFTLVEVVLSIIIISVGLFGIMYLFDNVTRGALEADLNTTAVYLARERMERIIAGKVYNGYNYVTTVNYPATEAVSVGGYNYSRNLTITEVSKVNFTTVSPGSGFKRIDVSVTWGVGGNQTITESTVIADY